MLGSQRSKQWFDAETFLGLARLRGIEYRAPDRYAEAFFRTQACSDLMGLSVRHLIGSEKLKPLAPDAIRRHNLNDSLNRRATGYRP